MKTGHWARTFQSLEFAYRPYNILFEESGSGLPIYYIWIACSGIGPTRTISSMHEDHEQENTQNAARRSVAAAAGTRRAVFAGVPHTCPDRDRPSARGHTRG